MGKGSSAPTSSTVTQTDLPEYARPYFEELLDRTATQVETPYQPFEGQRIAQPTPDILGARGLTRDIAGTGVAGLPQAMGTAASNIAQGQQIAAQAAQPFQFEQAGFSQYQPGVFGEFAAQRATPFSGFAERGVTPFADFEAQEVSQFQFDPTQRFLGANVQQYMSPYMQNVVEREQADALRQFQEQGGARAAQAVRAGAFGGSRQAVQEGIAERGLLNRLADIQATGAQQAFTQGAQLFGQDRAAEFARQQAQAAEQARAAGIGVQEAARVQQARAAELARTQGISVEEARRIQQAQAAEQARVQGLDIQEQARVQQARAAEQARLQGIEAGELGRVQAAGAAEQARVQAAQAAENRAAQQQQLQALGFTAEQAAQMVGFGEMGRATDIQNAQLLEAVGQQEREEAQRALDLGYEDFLRQQAYPEQQLQFFSSILRGVPVEPTVTQIGYQPYNPLQQALGGGLGAIGLYRGLMQ